LSTETSTWAILPWPVQAEAGDFVEAFAGQFHAAGGAGDDAARVHDEAELAGLAVGQEFGVVGGFLGRLGGFAGELKAAEPFDVGIAFPSGEDEAEGVALFRAEGFAVLAVDEHGVVQDLFHGDAAGHHGGVGAFGDHPLSIGLDADFGEDAESSNAGPIPSS
jgi:hypothetical protein